MVNRLAILPAQSEILDSVLADVRFAIRGLWTSLMFTFVAICSLGIGIGFTTTTFTIVDAVLFRSLLVANADRLVIVYTSATGATANADERFSSTSYPDYLDFKDRDAVFDDLIAYTPMFSAIKVRDGSRMAIGEIVTGNYFRMLGIRARIGRTLVPEDDAPWLAIGASRGRIIRLLLTESVILSALVRVLGCYSRPGFLQRLNRCICPFRFPLRERSRATASPPPRCSSVRTSQP